MDPDRILLLFAHPALQKSRAHRLLLEAVRDLEHLTLNDLYEEYPDFNIDVRREQDLLRQHDLIVFQHPLYWYSSPAILKEWQDLVLEYGFAYGEGGSALHGKKMLSAISSGGGQEAYQRGGYNHFTLREFLAPFEQTAKLCGMRYLPPFVAHGMHQRPEDAVMQAYAQTYRDLLVALRDHSLDLEQLGERPYLNDLAELPELNQKDGDHA
jgi:glutathione-regulated potassium-efflux system ancillary protein KefG